jgi:hypothetical protein
LTLTNFISQHETAKTYHQVPLHKEMLSLSHRSTKHFPLMIYQRDYLIHKGVPLPGQAIRFTSCSLLSITRTQLPVYRNHTHITTTNSEYLQFHPHTCIDISSHAIPITKIQSLYPNIDFANK